MKLKKFIYFILINCITQIAYAQSPCNGGSQNGNFGGSGNGSDNSFGWETFVIAAGDPNAITGPEGYGPERFIARKDAIPYTIQFENDPEIANAPARVVRITYPIDTNQNMLTFRIGSFGFNGFNFTVPPNKLNYTVRLDLIDSLGLYVDFTAGIDVINRQAFWLLESIDPLTGLPPTDPDKGFLPVSDSTINPLLDTTSLAQQGHGYVSFAIRPLNTTLTGDTMQAEAAIIFDINDPVATNKEKHTIDAFPPVSSISLLSYLNDTLALQFASQDDSAGSGVAYYDLYLAQDSLNFTTYATKVKDTIINIYGVPGKTYSFFSLATDNVGNREGNKSAADGAFHVPLDTNYFPIIFFNGNPVSQLTQNVCAGISSVTCFSIVEVDSDLVFYNISSPPVHGTAALNFGSTGVCINYESTYSYGGLDSLLFTACDLNSGCDSVWITFNVDSSYAWYADSDLDGFGNPLVTLRECAQPLGYVLNSADCNDNQYFINPSVPELCDNLDNNCNSIIDESCQAGVNLKVFLEGFYLSAGQMVAVIDPVSFPHLCDSLTLSLASTISPYPILYTDSRIIRTSGQATFYFPPGIVGQSYYLVVKHRNTIETWSKTPVLFNSPVITFDFTQ